MGVGFLAIMAAAFHGAPGYSEPQIQFMPREVYAGIETVVPREGLPALAASETAEIRQWLQDHDAEITGPSFVRLSETSDGRVRALVGIPIAADVVQNKRIHDGAFQEGFFAHSLVTGDWPNVQSAERSLIEWAEQRPRRRPFRPSAIAFIVQGDPTAPQVSSVLVRL